VPTINCPSCSRRLELPAGLSGQEVKCPGCAAVFLAQETFHEGGSVLSVGMEEPPGPWQTGDRVLAPWEPHWLYPGTVAEVARGGLNIHFDDGDRGWVPVDAVRAIDLDAGSRVFCRWQGSNLYHPGRITERRGEEIHVAYDDGRQEWSRIALVRVPSGVEPVWNEPPPSTQTNSSNNWLVWVALGIGLLFVIRSCAG
jgi:LSD1 subclass zinc finger protein